MSWAEIWTEIKRKLLALIPKNRTAAIIYIVMIVMFFWFLFFGPDTEILSEIRMVIWVLITLLGVSTTFKYWF